MAGGKFDKLAGKVRPGTYLNFESTRSDTVGYLTTRIQAQISRNKGVSK